MSTTTSSAASSSASSSVEPLGTNSTLYYVHTILITFIFLVSIAIFVVLRSVILRRRRQVAIANGTHVSDDDLAQYEKPDEYEEPQMYDVYVQWQRGGSKETRWDILSPISVTDPASAAYPTWETQPIPTPQPAEPQLTRGRRIWNEVKVHLVNFIPIYSCIEPTRCDSSLPTTVFMPDGRRMLQLAVLLHMPDPLHHSGAMSDLCPSDVVTGAYGGDEWVPYFEVGSLDAALSVTRVGPSHTKEQM